MISGWAANAGLIVKRKTIIIRNRTEKRILQLPINEDIAIVDEKKVKLEVPLHHNRPVHNKALRYNS